MCEYVCRSLKLMLGVLLNLILCDLLSKVCGCIQTSPIPANWLTRYLSVQLGCRFGESELFSSCLRSKGFEYHLDYYQQFSDVYDRYKT